MIESFATSTWVPSPNFVIPAKAGIHRLTLRAGNRLGDGSRIKSGMTKMGDGVADANPVTLNSFQGQFPPAPGAWCSALYRGRRSQSASFDHAARWTLKRVQGDEMEMGASHG